MRERRRDDEMERIEADRRRLRRQHVAQTREEFSDAAAQITRAVDDESRDDEQADERERGNRVSVATRADAPVLLPRGLHERRSQTVKVERRKENPEAERAKRRRQEIATASQHEDPDQRVDENRDLRTKQLQADQLPS